MDYFLKQKKSGGILSSNLFNSLQAKERGHREDFSAFRQPQGIEFLTNHCSFRRCLCEDSVLKCLAEFKVFTSGLTHEKPQKNLESLAGFGIRSRELLKEKLREQKSPWQICKYSKFLIFFV